MNLGSTNNSQANNKATGFDELIERLNNKIGYLLGRRNNRKNSSNKTSNRSFFYDYY